MIASSTEVMGYAIEALVLAGDWDGAETELAAAFARARELDEHAYVPMMLLLQARVAQGRGDAAAAYGWIRKSADLSLAQEAPAFELKAACELVAHPHATPEDRQRLSALLDSLAEGPDVPDVIRGRSLISVA